MNVLTFLAKNWDSVLVVVAFLAVVVVLIKRGETKILKQIPVSYTHLTLPTKA